MNKYTLIVPAYNEEKIIEDTVKTVCNHKQQIEEKYRVGIDFLVMDDGSKDNTKKYSINYHIRLILNRFMKTGLRGERTLLKQCLQEEKNMLVF